MSDHVTILQSKGLRAAKLSERTDDTEAGMIEEVTTGKYQVITESIFQKEWCDVFQSSAFKGKTCWNCCR